MIRLRFLFAISFALFVLSNVNADVLVIPSIGAVFDIAIGAETRSSVLGSIPMVFYGSSAVGVSLAPTIYYRTDEMTAFLPVHLVLFQPIFDNYVDLQFFLGGGPGIHSESGHQEFVPILQAGGGVIWKRMCLRFVIDAMFKYKYYNDIDTSISIMFGINLGRRYQYGK